MANPGSPPDLEIAVERAVGKVCGLGSSFWWVKMEWAGRG
jgi:hypothetical protein